MWWGWRKIEDFYFDISKYVKISDFPNELKTNYRWNEVVKLSVHNFEYFKKVVTCIDFPTYRYKYGNAEKIPRQFCSDLDFLFYKKLLIKVMYSRKRGVMIFSEREIERESVDMSLYFLLEKKIKFTFSMVYFCCCVVNHN